MRHLDPNLLLTLSVLLQTHSVSEAAQRLGLSQPTVSRALNALRTALGDPLLIRSGGRMVPTRRAMELAQPLEEWVALTAAVLQIAPFDPATLDRSFVIATDDYGLITTIAPLLPMLATTAPECRIEIVAPARDTMQRLAIGEIDIVIQALDPDHAATRACLLFEDGLSVLVRRGHPLHGKSAPAVGRDAYLAYPHIAVGIGPDNHDPVSAGLGADAAKRKVMVRVPGFQAAAGLIGNGNAIVTAPTRAARHLAATHGLACLSAPDIMAGLACWALVHERSARDHAIMWLVDQMARIATAPIQAVAA